MGFRNEGDWSNVNKEGQAFANPAPHQPSRRGGHPKERWLATARGRLGYPVDKWLFYVTGGAAWAKIDSAEWIITAPSATQNLAVRYSHRLDHWSRPRLRTKLWVVDPERIPLCPVQ